PAGDLVFRHRAPGIEEPAIAPEERDMSVVAVADPVLEQEVGFYCREVLEPDEDERPFVVRDAGEEVALQHFFIGFFEEIYPRLVYVTECAIRTEPADQVGLVLDHRLVEPLPLRDLVLGMSFRDTLPDELDEFCNLLRRIRTLLKVIISAAVQGIDCDMGEPFGSDDDEERLAPPRPDLLQHGKTVHVRHRIVRYDHIEIPGVYEFERLADLGYGGDRKPRLPFEFLDERVKEERLVIYA